MENNIYNEIERDINLLDPAGLERNFKQREHRRIKRIEYNQRAYLKNQCKLQQLARDRYRDSFMSVIQSPIEHDNIDYDML